MKIVLDKKSASKRQKNSYQDRFDKLRKQLEKQRRQNERFKADLGELVTAYKNHSQASDGMQIDTLKALAAKLTGFAAKKASRTGIGTNWRFGSMSL